MTKKDRFELVGTTIAGTFRVDAVVAEGGFGVVYRAFHLHFRAPVALKCLKIPDELTSERRAHFLEQFRAEAEILFHLSSKLPNIVRPLHVDAVQTSQGEFIPLMTLEWLEGKSFEKIIEEHSRKRQPPLQLSELVDLLTPVARALDQAHNFKALGKSLTIVHRDIKPDNLFLCDVGGEQMVKILDFGISKIRDSGEQMAGRRSQTQGNAPFSPAYGAPEQWVPKRYGQTGPWTDVWGLALTLVEILKGDAVITGDHQAMMGTALDPKRRPTPQNEGVDVSSDIDLVFQKALAIDPRFRYQSVREFWDALRAAMELSLTTSERRIRVQASLDHLPPMAAPEPWTPQMRESEPDPLADELPHLPPMLGPSPLEEDSPLISDPFATSYPNDPWSGLAPVPPAPGCFETADIEIPPLNVDLTLLSDDPALHAIPAAPPPLHLETSGRAELVKPPRETSSHVSPAELELAPTSIFPLAIPLADALEQEEYVSRESDAHEIPSLFEEPGFSHAPSPTRRGRGSLV